MSIRLHGDTTHDFDRTYRLALTLLGLGLLILILLNVYSGPRLRTVQMDSKKLTTQTGQRIVLHANQPLATIDQSKVRVEPAAAFSVANTADTITITFKQRLRYSSTYRVTIADVVAKNRADNKRTFTYQFTTGVPTLYYLKRASAFDQYTDKLDQIQRTSLNGDDTTQVFTAPKIIDYTVVGNTIIVSHTDTDSIGRLSTVDLDTKKISDIKLPDGGLATQLRSSSDGTSYGFIYSSPRQNTRNDAGSGSYFNTLFVGDTRPGHIAVPMSGIGGKPMSVFSWQFAPDGSSVIAHLTDQSLLLIDGNYKHAPVPLGTVSSISNFSADGTKLLVRSRVGFAILDLVKRTQAPAPDSQLESGLDSLINILLTPTDTGYLRHFQATSNDRTVFSDYLRYDQDGSKKIVYDTKNHSTDIQDIALSQNGQLVLLDTAADNDINYDGYPDEPRPLGSKVQIIDTISGKMLTELDGIKARLQ